MTREQKVLRINAEILMGLGLIFAAGAIPAVYAWLSIFFTAAHFPFYPAPDTLDPTGRLMMAISGGLTVGLGAMVWTVATEVLPVAPKEGRRVILFATGAWFVTDSTFSIVAGSPMNAFLNLSFVALMLWPSIKKGTAVADPS